MLVLKAMTLNAQWLAQGSDAMVTVTFNRQESQSVDLSDVSAERPIEIRFNDVAVGQNEIGLSLDGERPISYQIVTESYLPWDVVVEENEASAPQLVSLTPQITLDVAYDQSSVALNEVVNVEATMSVAAALPQFNMMAEVGLPPGFRPITADLEALVAETAVADYEIRRDKIVLYIDAMEANQTYTFRYRLTAQIPGTVQAPPSVGYPYYASNLRTIDGPQTLIVTVP